MTRRRFSARALTARLLEFNGRCADCNSKLGGAHGAIEWDHLIPLEMGGDDEIENLQPLCWSCHRAKTKTDAGHIAKSKRMKQRDLGIKRRTKRPLPGSRDSGWKHTFSRGWVRR